MGAAPGPTDAVGRTGSIGRTASIGRTEFVGRTDEVALLRAAAAGDGPAVVLVEGPPGVGKSSLARHALEPSAWVLAERDEQGLAYGVLSRLLAALDTAGAFTPVAPATDPYAVGLVLLDRLAPGASVVIDDVQWADAPSVRALAVAVRRLRAERVLVALVLRTGEPVGDDLARLLAHPEVRRMPIGGLSVSDTASLCRAVAGVALPHAAVARLHHATGGNPLWLQAAAADSVRRGRTGPAEALPPPAGYADLVRRDLAAATSDVRAAATAVAVAGSGTLAELASPYAVAGGVGPLPAALAAATEAALVAPLAPGDDRYRPRHALTGAAVYWSLAPADRAALHRGAATTADPDRALDHRCAADVLLHDDVDLDDDLARRMAAARAGGETARAAEIAEVLAGRATGAAEAVRQWIVAGLCLLEAGELERAGRAAARVPESEESAAADALRGTLALLTGRVDTADPLLRRGFESAGDDASIAGLCAAQLTMITVNHGLGAETLVWADRSARLTPGDGLAQLMRHAAEGVLADGPLPDRRSAVPSSGRAGYVVGTGVQRMWRGDEPGAVVDLRSGLAAALDGGPIVVAAIAGYYVVECTYRLGDLRGALAASEENLALAHAADLTWVFALARSTPVATLLALGQDDLAEQRLRAAESAQLGNFADILWLAVGNARLRLARGDAEGALTAARGTRSFADAAGAQNPNVQPWQLLEAEALLRLGRTTEADAVLAPHTASLRGWPRPWTAVQVVRLTAWSRRLQGDVVGAERLLSDAVAAYGAHPSWEAAMLRLELGALLRRRGRRMVAATHLGIAKQRLADMGAVAGVADLRRELDGIGPGEVLTTRERTIAELVGEGRSNREIAAALHLSVKTVEFHLGRVFGKLGVRSRGGVATALARADAAQT